MNVFVIQYLEPSPAIATRSPHDVKTRLRSAFERLPLAAVLLGWNLPEALVDACAGECNRVGADLYYWHPLLSGSGSLAPRPEWQTVGLRGQPIPGFAGKPEFTFICPNHPAVQETVLERVQEILHDDRYQGIFLDRMRFPSPAANPENELGCFCAACAHAAAQDGLDLRAVRQHLLALLTAPEGLNRFLQTLFDPETEAPDTGPLKDFLAFRCRSISRFVHQVSELAYAQERRVGLDCFSPGLTHTVGQDLRALDGYCDWIKIMSYGHSLGPAGVPFELLGWANWLIERQGLAEPEALTRLAGATHLPLPKTRAALHRFGLSPAALEREARRAKKVGVRALLAGMELVEIAGVAELTPDQISADLKAFAQAGVEGLALSWDLWHIPLERLDLIRAQTTGVSGAKP